MTPDRRGWSSQLVRVRINVIGFTSQKITDDWNWVGGEN